LSGTIYREKESSILVSSKSLEFTHVDFVVWTTQDIHIERIKADYLFIKSQLKVANEFCISGILPELLAKWCTRTKSSQVKNCFITSCRSM